MRVLKIFLIVVVVLIVIISAWIYFAIFKELPSVDELQTLETTRLSKVVASDGSIIAYYPPQGMIVINGADIPELVKKAFISAEDATFYKHKGLDFRRMVSAMMADIKAKSYVQGASTITQQVVKTYLLSKEKTLIRKIKEALLSLKMEHYLSKEQILTLYLNRIYLGSGAYGVESASLRYFEKPCKELTLAETAMIAGLAPAPAKYSPLVDFRQAKKRQQYVLTRMLNEHLITREEATNAFKEPLKIKGRVAVNFSRYPFVSDYVKTLVVQRYGEEFLSKGVTIFSTIDTKLEDDAIRAVKKGIMELELRQGLYAGPARGLSADDKEKIFSLQTNQILWEGFKLYELYWAEVINTSPLTLSIENRSFELGPERYAWINPKGRWDPKTVLMPGDIVRLCYTPEGSILYQDNAVQGALVSFDLEKSAVTALVGGTDYTRSQFNRAIYAKRQSGSAIKPFIYSAAIDKGYTPASIILDAPITFDNEERPDEEAYKPKNYENKYFGPTSLRTGLVKSRNVVTIKLFNEMGIGYALDYLNSFKMETEFPRNMSIALGSAAVTPYNLAKAYGVFAMYGQRFEPHIIDRIVLGDGKILFDYNNEKQIKSEQAGIMDGNQVISEQTAYMITNILVSAVREGTGWRAKSIGRIVAGKTGTTNDYKDAWFIGYTPDTLCGIWIGNDNMKSLGENEAGGRAAAPVFADFMQVAAKGKKAKDFRVPDGIVFARINSKTGLLSEDPQDADARFECFKEDNMPQAEDKTAPADDMLKEVF